VAGAAPGATGALDGTLAHAANKLVRVTITKAFFKASPGVWKDDRFYAKPPIPYVHAPSFYPNTKFN
jgi:hypothetical protein